MANGYAYRPFGAFYEGECVETVDSPFCFTGQWRDAEIDQYDLRARQYDPAMMRFMTRDPVRGDFAEPMTLHRYLYCQNEPVSRVDPTGECFSLAGLLVGIIVHDAFKRTDYARLADAFAVASTGIGVIYDIVYFGPHVATFVQSTTSGGGALKDWVDRFEDWWSF